MALTKQESEAIISDESKLISEDIVWTGHPNSPSRTFRVDVKSTEGYPIFIDGWYNPLSGKLSYSIIHRSEGRIYGLDLGAEHINPDGEPVGEKHKNYWNPPNRDKWAYAPEDITEPWDRPVAVWSQFCAEANLRHTGTIQEPSAQGSLPL